MQSTVVNGKMAYGTAKANTWTERLELPTTGITLRTRDMVRVKSASLASLIKKASGKMTC